MLTWNKSLLRPTVMLAPISPHCAQRPLCNRSVKRWTSLILTRTLLTPKSSTPLELQWITSGLLLASPTRLHCARLPWSRFRTFAGTTLVVSRLSSASLSKAFNTPSNTQRSSSSLDFHHLAVSCFTAHLVRVRPCWQKLSPTNVLQTLSLSKGRSC